MADTNDMNDEVLKTTAEFRRLEWLIYETGTDEEKTLITSLHVKFGKFAKAFDIEVPPAGDDVHPEALAAYQKLADGGK
ncbi:hypothetical protein [Parvibaculum sp.]|uniref:hypothetical protein n=1 Tax=Parvibaculum sp. TaxID=2024848 RepID=UPI002B83E720|nr:hypothetical protein [Parvibaculum sp.]HUD52790.1 hypothetical protein [Parvibaculum sp.]